MAKGEREGSSLLLLWPTLFGAGGMSYSRSSVQSQTIPPMSKQRLLGVEDGGAFSVSVNVRNLLLTQ